jgi:hypothetical protein
VADDQDARERAVGQADEVTEQAAPAQHAQRYAQRMERDRGAEPVRIDPHDRVGGLARHGLIEGDPGEGGPDRHAQRNMRELAAGRKPARRRRCCG